MKKISFVFAILATLTVFSTALAGITLIAPVSLAEPIKMLFFGIGVASLASFAKTRKFN